MAWMFYPPLWRSVVMKCGKTWIRPRSKCVVCPFWATVHTCRVHRRGYYQVLHYFFPLWQYTTLKWFLSTFLNPPLWLAAVLICQNLRNTPPTKKCFRNCSSSIGVCSESQFYICMWSSGSLHCQDVVSCYLRLFINHHSAPLQLQITFL